jgi:hypothetical protein
LSMYYKIPRGIRVGRIYCRFRNIQPQIEAWFQPCVEHIGLCVHDEFDFHIESNSKQLIAR